MLIIMALCTVSKFRHPEKYFNSILGGPGKTTYPFSVTFRLACYQQAGRVWSGRKGTETMLALAENVYVVLPTPYTGRHYAECHYDKSHGAFFLSSALL